MSFFSFFFEKNISHTDDSVLYGNDKLKLIFCSTVWVYFQDQSTADGRKVQIGPTNIDSMKTNLSPPLSPLSLSLSQNVEGYEIKGLGVVQGVVVVVGRGVERLRKR